MGIPPLLASQSAGFIALPHAFNSQYGWRKHFLLGICTNVSSVIE